MAFPFGCCSFPRSCWRLHFSGIGDWQVCFWGERFAPFSVSPAEGGHKVLVMGEGARDTMQHPTRTRCSAHPPVQSAAPCGERNHAKSHGPYWRDMPVCLRRGQPIPRMSGSGTLNHQGMPIGPASACVQGDPSSFLTSAPTHHVILALSLHLLISALSLLSCPLKTHGTPVH
jgi:hypothetical protein